MRLQLAKGLKIDAAKKYVAEKLGITPLELSDSTVMSELRAKLNIGRMQPTDGVAIGMEAKIRIAKILDIKINSVERFRERSGI